MSVPSHRIWNFRWQFPASLFDRWKNCSWSLTNIRFCWYWLIWEVNRLVFAPTALICCFISSFRMFSLFHLMLYLLLSLSLCFFLIFLFSNKLLTNSKSLINSFNFASNLLLHQSFFYLWRFVNSNQFRNICCNSIHSIVQLSKISNINFLKHTVDLAYITLHLCFPNPT